MTIKFSKTVPTVQGHYLCIRPSSLIPEFVFVDDRNGTLWFIGKRTEFRFGKLTGKELWSERLEFEKGDL